LGGENISEIYEPEITGRGSAFLNYPSEEPGEGEGKEEIFESCRIKGVIFDCYQTLIDIHTEEHSIETYEILSTWLAYDFPSIFFSKPVRFYLYSLIE